MIDKILEENFVKGVWKEYEAALIEQEVMQQTLHDTLKRKNAYAIANNVVDGFFSFYYFFFLVF
jgi:hypothetical protein